MLVDLLQPTAIASPVKALKAGHWDTVARSEAELDEALFVKRSFEHTRHTLGNAWSRVQLLHTNRSKDGQSHVFQLALLFGCDRFVTPPAATCGLYTPVINIDMCALVLAVIGRPWESAWNDGGLQPKKAAVMTLRPRAPPCTPCFWFGHVWSQEMLIASSSHCRSFWSWHVQRRLSSRRVMGWLQGQS